MGHGTCDREQEASAKICGTSFTGTVDCKTCVEPDPSPVEGKQNKTFISAYEWVKVCTVVQRLFRLGRTPVEKRTANDGCKIARPWIMSATKKEFQRLPPIVKRPEGVFPPCPTVYKHVSQPEAVSRLLRSTV